MNCDIVIPVWNELKLTQNCIDRIIKNTHYPYRLIIIDNGSDRETKRYLEFLKDNKDLDLTLIKNENNLGFVKAVNQGIRVASSPYICLLNNDTEVFGGWLREMINVAKSSPQIGIVNPSSNTLGQKPVRGESFKTYVSKLKMESNKWEELASCTGFCMLIKQEVVKKIGGLDEVYGMGNFEDTDFSFQAKSLGYKCVRAKGAYVLHREKMSFKRLINHDKSFKKNQKIFWQRWGIPQRVLYIVTKSDNGYYERIKRKALELAQKGSWVTIFQKEFLDTISIPEHSNINLFSFPERRFYLRLLWRILKKKKKFNLIHTDDLKFNSLLNKLKFVHKAELRS